MRHANVADAHHNSHNRYPPPCDPGTRLDILAKISECLSGPGISSICWLYGVAGSGKSAIAQSISEVLTEKGKLAASFFFNREDDQRSSTKHVIATIAYQLAINVPNAKGPICEALQHDQTILDTVFDNQLGKLIVEPLQSLPEPESPWVIVIDALDECGDVIRMSQLITTLAVLRSNGRIQFFVTSRIEPYIRAIFTDTRRNISVLSYDLQDFKADDDLRLFFKNRLHEIRHVRSHVMPEISESWPSNDELDALVRKSSGLFIYASTVVKFIGSEHTIPDKQLEVVLNIAERPNARIHADLDQLYKQVLSTSPDLDQLRLVIGAIILLRTPLSPLELACLLGMEVAQVLLVLEGLHSILSIPPTPNAGTLTSYHLSLRDFLTSPERAGIYFVDPPLKHADLAECCLKHVVKLPKFAYPTLGDPARCQQAVEQHLRELNSGDRIAVRYACWYWPSHTLDSDAKRKAQNLYMKAFCRRYTLSWSMIIFGVQPNMEMARERDWNWERKIDGWRRAAEAKKALEERERQYAEKRSIFQQFREWCQEKLVLRLLQGLALFLYISWKLLELCTAILWRLQVVIWLLQVLLWVVLHIVMLAEEKVWTRLAPVVQAIQRALDLVTLSHLVELAMQRGMRLLLELMVIPAILFLVVVGVLLWPLLWKPAPNWDPLPREVEECLTQAKSCMDVSRLLFF